MKLYETPVDRGDGVDLDFISKLTESHKELLELLSEVIGYNKLTYRPSDDTIIGLHTSGSDFNRMLQAVARGRGLTSK